MLNSENCNDGTEQGFKTMANNDLLVVDSLSDEVVASEATTVAVTPAAPPYKQILDNLAAWERKYRAAKSTATLKAVRADWQVFVEWCERNRRWALPAAPEVLQRFFADMVGLGKKRSTLNRYVNTIRLVHGGAGLADPTLYPGWKLEWEALVRQLTALGANAPRQAEPLSSEGVKAILAMLGSKPIDLRDAALISLASDTLCRESELVRLRREDIKKSGRGYAVDLRENKTDQEGLGSTRFCSVATKNRIDLWCKAAGIKTGYIFVAIGRKKAGSDVEPGKSAPQAPRRRSRPAHSNANASVTSRQTPQPLRPPEVARILRRRAMAAGIDAASAITGHSARVGSAIDLLEFGQSPTAVQFAGGWKSQRMVLHYGRRALTGQGAMAALREAEPLVAAPKSKKDPQ